MNEEEDFSNGVSTTYDAAEGVYFVTDTSRAVGSFESFNEAVDAVNGIEVSASVENKLKYLKGKTVRRDTYRIINNVIGFRETICPNVYE